MPRFGLVKTSLIDYPGRIAAVLFTHGCNLRCPYCHNPELVDGAIPADFVDWEEVRRFLEGRRRLLGGVVISGGEPLLHPWLPEIVDAIRDMGYAVKVDTNGSFPDRLRQLNADYVAVDLKGSAESYARLGGAGVHGLVLESIEVVKNRWPGHHEVRTVIAPGLVGEADLDGLAAAVRGVHSYVLVECRLSGPTLDPGYRPEKTVDRTSLVAWRTRLRAAGVACDIRTVPGSSGEGT